MDTRSRTKRHGGYRDEPARAVSVRPVAAARRTRGQVDTGLGKSARAAEPSRSIAPTGTIDKTMREARPSTASRSCFNWRPDSEAPSEMLMYFPQFRVLDMAEDVDPQHAQPLHHPWLPRCATGNLWSRYISEAMETLRRQERHHHRAASLAGMPGKARVVAFLKKQRDLYKFIHDQSRAAAQSWPTRPAEIAETTAVCRASAREQEWSARGYYGTLSHNAKAVYQLYLGWYDANPADLNPLPRVGGARRSRWNTWAAPSAVISAGARRFQGGPVPLGCAGDEPARVC